MLHEARTVSGRPLALVENLSETLSWLIAGINELDPTPFRNYIVEDGYPIRSMAYSSDGS